MACFPDDAKPSTLDRVRLLGTIEEKEFDRSLETGA
jgi:hypothetical protein